MRQQFSRFATWASAALGAAWAFLATLIVFTVFYGAFLLGFIPEAAVLHFTLIISMLTQLSAQLIENTQGRNDKALHAKVDELIKANADARNDLRRAEELDDEKLEQLRSEAKL